MSLPLTLNKANPPQSETPQLGAGRIRTIITNLQDLFTLPDNTSIPFAILDGSKGIIPVVLTNNTGAPSAIGDVLALGLGADNSAEVADAQAGFRKYCIAQAVIQAGSTGPYVFYGRTLANTTGTVNRGDYVRKSATTKTLESTGVNMSDTALHPAGTMGIALTAAAAGQATIYLYSHTVLRASARSYLSNLQLSTAGGSATMTVAVGEAMESTNVFLMQLLTSINKTTAAWVVGTGNGGLDTGAIAANTWYHFWLIQRLDTGVVDVLISLSATTPTMPANYTLKRRIGSAKTDGSSFWTAFVQLGDEFLLKTSVRDLNTTSITTTSSTFALASVPTGIQVWALFRAAVGGTNLSAVLFTSPDETDQAVATGLESLFLPVASQAAAGHFQVRTSVTATIRAVSGSAGGVTTDIWTYGWIDRRGRDS